MSKTALNVSRGEANSPADALKAHVEAQFASALEKASLELTQTGVGHPGNLWEVYAWGPWQNFAAPSPRPPGRIIMTGETAYIAAGVWINDTMLADLLGFGAHFELSFFTANTQTMMPLPALEYNCCIYPEEGRHFYSCVWEFVPTEEGCLYETNICSRVCSCRERIVPDYAGFVRHVYDFDPETLFPGGPDSPTPGWQFDRPVRYMVADRNSACVCPDDPPTN